MKHNKRNKDFKFQVEPEEFNKNTDKELLQHCLGGTLYMPATQIIAEKLIKKEITEMKSMVMCFEDAIRAQDLNRAEENVLSHLQLLARSIEKEEIQQKDIPLIFLRVRNLDQYQKFCRRLNKDQAKILSGFVYPKFDSVNSESYLEQLDELNSSLMFICTCQFSKEKQ